MRLARTLTFWALALYAASGIYFIQPDEQAVVRRFGRAQAVLAEPGAHWCLPWPLDRVDRLRGRETKRITLGLADSAGGTITTGATQLLTGDRNLINVRATVQYTASDPTHFLFGAADAEAAIRSACEALLTEALASEGVDHALTLGKRELGLRTAERLQAWCDACPLGVSIRSVDLAAVEPPPEVAESFEQVTAALREREQAINEAQSYATQTQSTAEGNAQRDRDRAEAFRDRTVAQAQGHAERFASLLTEYRRQPELTQTRLYWEAMIEILPRLRSKLVIDAGQGLDLSVIRETPGPKPAMNKP